MRKKRSDKNNKVTEQWEKYEQEINTRRGRCKKVQLRIEKDLTDNDFAYRSSRQNFISESSYIYVAHPRQGPSVTIRISFHPPNSDTKQMIHVYVDTPVSGSVDRSEVIPLLKNKFKENELNE